MSAKDDIEREQLAPSNEDHRSTEEHEPTEGHGSSDLVELVLADHDERQRRQEPPSRIDGVVIGHLHSIGEDGRAMVQFEEWPRGALPARAMLAFGPSDVGRPCALLFEAADPARPVLMGWMFEPTSKESDGMQSDAKESVAVPEAPRVVEQGTERLVFEAHQEIVLRCGKASITLTRAGKILIRGAYLLARSSGTNRIQGGSVQIN